MSTDQHAIFAVATDGATYRLGNSMSWGAAQDEWERHDNARRAGLRPHVSYYAVRSIDDPDPRWVNARTEEAQGVWQTLPENLPPFKLTSDLRGELISEGFARRRELGGQGVDPVEISDHVFSIMLNEPRFGTEEYEATEISDYAYGIARFVTPKSELGWY